MKQFLILFLFLACLSLTAAMQYNFKGNQGYLTFDSDTTLSFEVGTTGKDNDHENFIDRGEGIIDYGWYNLETGKSGSFDNNSVITFSVNDKIGLYVTDNKGNTYLSTKPNKIYPFENDIWGKSKMVDGMMTIGGGNFGSNGTHEYYAFKINAVTNQNQVPTGQPLPGIIATLILGAVRNFLFEK
jgi:hypothetical protein